MRFFRTLAIAPLFALAAALAGCRPPVTQLAVPLEYRPTGTLRLEKIGGAVTGAPPLAVAVSDDRADKTAVGKNVEKEGHPVPVLATRSTPEQFLTDAVARALGQAGVTVAEPGQARCTLRLSITSFWTEEASTYRGSIAANASLVSKGGAPLWSGAVTGQSKRFGRSLSPENYQETFSDASIDLVQSLLANPGLRSALPCAEPQREKAKEKPSRRKRR